MRSASVSKRCASAVDNCLRGELYSEPADLSGLGSFDMADQCCGISGCPAAWSPLAAAQLKAYYLVASR